MLEISHLNTAKCHLSWKKVLSLILLWEAKGGVVNFYLHGDDGDNNISYEKRRAISG
ncbi:MAG: hypothetical protein DHS20C08_16200 [Rhodomicrobium sp.]|jgi:hypothetical protein|nr:MAG: hypothetical protein DHS20C08_16200 [Rhodomicrobium sp.]